jgi:hypothetical protein
MTAFGKRGSLALRAGRDQPGRTPARPGSRFSKVVDRFDLKNERQWSRWISAHACSRGISVAVPRCTRSMRRRILVARVRWWCAERGDVVIDLVIGGERAEDLDRELSALLFGELGCEGENLAHAIG